MEDSKKFPQKIELPHEPGIPLLGGIQKKFKKDLKDPSFVAALSTAANMETT